MGRRYKHARDIETGETILSTAGKTGKVLSTETNDDGDVHLTVDWSDIGVARSPELPPHGDVELA